MLDGQIDYSHYTRDQLWDALRHIDRARFPLNLANLERALETAKPPVPPPLPSAVELAARKRRRQRWILIIVGVLVLLAALAVTGLHYASKAKLAAQTQATTAYLAKNPKAVGSLGAPIVVSDLSTEAGDDGKLVFKANVKGAHSAGTVKGRLHQDSGEWKIGAATLSVAGQTESMDLATE